MCKQPALPDVCSPTAIGALRRKGDTREHPTGGHTNGCKMENLKTELSLFSLLKRCSGDHKMPRHLKHGNFLGCRGLPKLLTKPW